MPCKTKETNQKAVLLKASEVNETRQNRSSSGSSLRTMIGPLGASTSPLLRSPLPPTVLRLPPPPIIWMYRIMAALNACAGFIGLIAPYIFTRTASFWWHALKYNMLFRVASSAARTLLSCDLSPRHVRAMPVRALTMGMAAKKSSSAEDIAKAAAHDVLHTTSIVVSVKHNVPGALLRILQPFCQHGISISKIESRPSKSPSWDFDFLMTFEGSKDDSNVKTTMSHISQYCHSLTVLGSHHTPWFPRTLQDLDRYADRKLEYGGDLGEDHPGFVDPAYRARRSHITQNAVTYRTGAQLPRVECVRCCWRRFGCVSPYLSQLHRFGDSNLGCRIRQSHGSGAHSCVPRVPVHFACNAREVQLLARSHPADEPHL